MEAAIKILPTQAKAVTTGTSTARATSGRMAAVAKIAPAAAAGMTPPDRMATKAGADATTGTAISQGMADPPMVTRAAVSPSPAILRIKVGVIQIIEGDRIQIPRTKICPADTIVAQGRTTDRVAATRATALVAPEGCQTMATTRQAIMGPTTTEAVVSDHILRSSGSISVTERTIQVRNSSSTARTIWELVDYR